MQNRLITISMSHYCEKARWALERAGIAYREERHLQVFHFWHVSRARGGDTVPVLVTETAEVLADSTDILHWVDTKSASALKLYPPRAPQRQQVEALEDHFDEGLGVAGRLWMYTFVLNEIPLLIRYAKKHGVPWYELKLLPLVFPFMKGKMQRILGMTATSREDSRKKVSRVLDEVAATLRDGRPYLTGARFTAADLTFAALSAAILLPKNYGVELPELAELPSEMADQIQQWRQHPAGKFALKLYAEQRHLKKA